MKQTSATRQPGLTRSQFWVLATLAFQPRWDSARLGWEVVGADEDAAKVELINSGKVPFFEPGLDDLLNWSLASGRFQATPDVTEAIRSATVVFICVGTPQRRTERPIFRKLKRSPGPLAGT